MGSNGVRYKHIYYFAIYKKDNIDNELLINRDKYEQYSEISDLQWVPIEMLKQNKKRIQNPRRRSIKIFYREIYLKILFLKNKYIYL